MFITRRKRMRLTGPGVAVAIALTAFTAGCGGAPGGDNKDAAAENKKEAAKTVSVPDPSKAGNVTLTVWDQEVRGGQAASIKRLNKSFQAKYPNVKIKRVAKSFDDLNKTLKLAVTGSKAPDVVEANQGRPIMGTLVKGGLLRPLDPYAEAFKWQDRYSELLLDLNKFSPDGKTFGEGNLYGLSQMGEIVGVFYNKDKVTTPPTTLEEFEQSLADAKKAGDVPIQFGNLDKWPGIHEYETVYAGAGGDKQAIRDFTFGRSGASFDSPDFQNAAQKIQDWAKKGYFTPDFNGTGYDPAWQRFAKGKGHYLIAGTWLVADLAKQMGDKVGFMTIPGQSADAEPVALGGESLPFAITKQSKHPDVAAAYIDHLTNAEASKVLAETGNLPAIPGGEEAIPEGLPSDVFESWNELREADGLIPYLDYTTPTAGDEFSGSIQEMLAGKADPKAFTADIQGQFEKFMESNQ
jgi:raffinose/stachyose/melibiose transport system substrate-binding protein